MEGSGQFVPRSSFTIQRLTQRNESISCAGEGENEELVQSYRDQDQLREITFIKTTYDISLDSQISLLPLGFSLLLASLSRIIQRLTARN